MLRTDEGAMDKWDQSRKKNAEGSRGIYGDLIRLVWSAKVNAFQNTGRRSWQNDVNVRSPLVRWLYT
jgi:hypothetical protein